MMHSGICLVIASWFLNHLATMNNRPNMLDEQKPAPTGMVQALQFISIFEVIYHIKCLSIFVHRLKYYQHLPTVNGFHPSVHQYIFARPPHESRHLPHYSACSFLHPGMKILGILIFCNAARPASIRYLMISLHFCLGLAFNLIQCRRKLASKMATVTTWTGCNWPFHWQDRYAEGTAKTGRCVNYFLCHVKIAFSDPILKRVLG